MIYKTTSDEETKTLGQKLAQSLEPGSILALVGDLGGGKTCFVQGLARGLQIPEEVKVSSPTFVILHEYPGGTLPLYHFDFYRLGEAKETLDLNLEEYFEGSGISVVEWADRFPKLFPDKTQWIHFKFLSEQEREIRC